MSSITYLLGAGFTCGFNARRIPVVRNFLEIAETLGNYKPQAEHRDLAQFVNRYFGGESAPDIESLATFLTTRLTSGDSLEEQTRKLLYQKLLRIIIATLGFVHHNAQDKDVLDVYQSFAAKLMANGSNVVTFNYDLLLENLLVKKRFPGGSHDSSQYWSPDDGYGFEIPPMVPEKPAPPPTTIFIGPKVRSKLVSAVRLYKLHGSLNLGKRNIPYPDGRNPIVVAPIDKSTGEVIPIWGLSILGVSSHIANEFEPLIVPPIATKEQIHSNPLLQNTWSAAEQVTAQSSQLYILGYSFPRTDYYSEFLFREAFAASSNQISVTVVNRENDNGEYRARVSSILRGARLDFGESDVVNFLKTHAAR